jgi:hypothetical protein
MIMFIKNNMKTKNTILRTTEQGYAAFTVTLILMVVLSLIVLGFSQSSRREGQNALYNQLSTAAYYAAESGINDAYNIIKADYQNSVPLIAQTNNCVVDNNSNHSYVNTTNSNVLHGSGVSGQVVYTCLIVNPSPPTLVYAPIDQGHAQVVPIFGKGPSGATQALKSVTLSWQKHDLTSATNYAGCPIKTSHTFAPESGVSKWSLVCDAAVLQVDIVPADGNAWATNTLQQYTNTVFLEPDMSSPSTVTTSLINGNISGAHCSTGSHTSAYDCVSTITLPVSTDSNYSLKGYYLHITPIYDNVDISICSSNDSIGGTCNPNIYLYNAQALIDSTGKASDQLKRIEERVSINPVENNNQPAYAIQSTNSICKQFTSRPGFSEGFGAKVDC